MTSSVQPLLRRSWIIEMLLATEILEWIFYDDVSTVALVRYRRSSNTGSAEITGRKMSDLSHYSL